MDSDLHAAKEEIRDLRRENAFLRKKIAIHERFSRNAERIVGRIERKLDIIGKRWSPKRKRSTRRLYSIRSTVGTHKG